MSAFIKFKIPPRLNELTKSNAFISYDARQKLQQKFAFINEKKPLTDPIGKIAYDDEMGRVSIEIFTDKCTEAQIDAIKQEIASWVEFNDFEV